MSTTNKYIPPHSIDAEQFVLGGLLTDNHTWDRVADLIIATDFYRHDHRLIFSIIAHMSEAGLPFDAVTVAEALDRQGDFESAGGSNYLNVLINNTPSTINIETYAKAIQEKSILRQLLKVSTDVVNIAVDPTGENAWGNVAELIDLAEQKIFAINEKQGRHKRNFIQVKDLLPSTESIKTHKPITGVPTGFSDLDELLSGFQRSDLIIVAGRPSMGKTSFAMNIAEHAAVREQEPIAVFSMEMPGEQLTMRLLSSVARIDQHKLRTGKLDDDDWPRLTTAVGILTDAPIYTDDTPALSPTEVRTRARRVAREHGLGMIVLDYLQLMQASPGARKENRTTEISDISRSLKALAKELNVPVVALSQLNRSLEQRPDKRPIMSDLRESGAIEQDADVIIFIYRDEVYNEESPAKGTAEIIVRKQRNGDTGTVLLGFDGKYTRFENLHGSSLSTELSDMPRQGGHIKSFL